MTNTELIKKLEQTLSPHRFAHTMGVADTAKILAERFGADKEKAYLAALLHDCAKELPEQEQKRLCKKYNIRLDHVSERESKLWHAYVGAHMARDVYGCTDSEIFDAIYFHTTGKKNMSLLLKIIFLSDAIEPCRGEREALVKIRDVAKTDLDFAIIMTLDDTIGYILSKGGLLHLDTLKARNYLLEVRKE